MKIPKDSNAIIFHDLIFKQELKEELKAVFKCMDEFSEAELGKMLEELLGKKLQELLRFLSKLRSVSPKNQNLFHAITTDESMNNVVN